VPIWISRGEELKTSSYYREADSETSKTRVVGPRAPLSGEDIRNQADRRHGRPDPDRVCTSHIDRQNLTMNANATIDAVNKWLFKEVGEPEGCLRSAFCLLQFLPNPFIEPLYSSNGSGYNQARLEPYTRELADRTEGKAKQAVQLDTKGEALQLLAAFLGVSVDQLPSPD
jgi:hypothetical protein